MNELIITIYFAVLKCNSLDAFVMKSNSTKYITQQKQPVTNLL